MKSHRQQLRRLVPQRGIVLIVALVMLAIISLLAATSIGNTGSSEAVLANTRLKQLATQSAEIGLRFCEEATVQTIQGTPPPLAPSIQAFATPSLWKGTPTAVWDATPTAAFVIPLATVNPPGTSATFARPPECIVERLGPPGTSQYDKAFVITARGFGPDVAPASPTRAKPVGTEVFLQSTIELD
jgi:type IV pilus assembly protein PilX